MTAVDRFHAVLFALRPALFNRKTCFKIIVVLWVSSVAFHWRCLYELVKGKPGIICAFLLRMELDLMKRQLTSGITWLCLIFVSVTALIVLYSSISVSLYLQKKSNHLGSLRNHSAAGERKSKNHVHVSGRSSCFLRSLVYL